MEPHYVKGNRSRSDLHVSIFQWENKVMDTESKRKVCGKWTREKSFVHGTSFLGMLSFLS